MTAKPEKPKKRPMQVLIEPDLYAAASEKAKQLDLNLSQVVRLLLKDWVAKKQQQMFF